MAPIGTGVRGLIVYGHANVSYGFLQVIVFAAWAVMAKVAAHTSFVMFAIAAHRACTLPLGS